jgi:predicted short-subunit dehydrogenase-like oxidoreductase (DUF2520 family)
VALAGAGYPITAVEAADLIILAVPDDALPAVVADLVVGPGKLVAHTSGAHGLAVLDPVTKAGAGPLAIHPAMTFTGAAGDLDRLRAGIEFGVTAPPHLRPTAERLVKDLGGTPEWIDESARPLYHAALAHGANHLVTVVNDAMDLLRAAGARHPEAMLRPLLTAALDNALRMGDAALTGPVARGDAGTVRGHLTALARTAPDVLPTYTTLARRTAERAVAAGRLSAADAATLVPDEVR